MFCHLSIRLDTIFGKKRINAMKKIKISEAHAHLSKSWKGTWSEKRLVTMV